MTSPALAPYQRPPVEPTPIVPWTLGHAPIARPAPPVIVQPVLPTKGAETLSNAVAGPTPNLTPQTSAGGEITVPSDGQLSLFAHDAYRGLTPDPNGPQELPAELTDGGWARLEVGEGANSGMLVDPRDPSRTFNIDPALLENKDGSGLQASVYVNERGGAVVAYAGTDFGEAADVQADATQAFGLENQQYTQAQQLALETEAAVGDGQVVFAGHSLGGALASYGALATGSSAVTFNAAGLSDQSLDRLQLPADIRGTLAESGQIRRYSVEGDQLTVGQQDLWPTRGAPDAVGREFVLDNPANGIVEHSNYLEAIRTDQTPELAQPADTPLDRVLDATGQVVTFAAAPPLIIGTTAWKGLDRAVDVATAALPVVEHVVKNSLTEAGRAIGDTLADAGEIAAQPFTVPFSPATQAGLTRATDLASAAVPVVEHVVKNSLTEAGRAIGDTLADAGEIAAQPFTVPFSPATQAGLTRATDLASAAVPVVEHVVKNSLTEAGRAIGDVLADAGEILAKPFTLPFALQW